MRKVILLVVLFASLAFTHANAANIIGWDGQVVGGSSSKERGNKKIGDSNYNKSYQDREIYGSRNAYQGSSSGDSDWSSRNIQQMNQDHDEQMKKSRSW